MDDIAKEIIPINISEEMKSSYMDYAMSVIVGRALPDARDGLKPVHRRTLYAMDVLNNDWNRAHKKSARIVGDVIGKYHPHGDSAVYETIVRMAQDFALRYPLIDGQGNFGSMDGDGAAAMRYTEIRMSKISNELMADLNKDTVNFVENYDGTESIPEVLPTKIPNLLINGSSGIAVGMATNMLPHNLTESINAAIAILESPDLEVEDLLKIIPAPDFPTGGIINGTQGIIEAAKTGRGKVILRAKTEIETDKKDKSKISSLKRVSRNFGFDYTKSKKELLKLISKKLIDIQLNLIFSSVENQLKLKGISKKPPIIGLGIGKDLIASHCKVNNYKTECFKKFLSGSKKLLTKAVYHAPAAACAFLLNEQNFS